MPAKIVVKFIGLWSVALALTLCSLPSESREKGRPALPLTESDAEVLPGENYFEAFIRIRGLGRFESYPEFIKQVDQWASGFVRSMEDKPAMRLNRFETDILGRSVQAPQTTIEFPRRLAVFTVDMRPVIFLGYAPLASKMEILSYNPSRRRLDALKVENFGPGLEPRISRIKEISSCSTCHQSKDQDSLRPIFARFPWEETGGVVGQMELAMIQAHIDGRVKNPSLAAFAFGEIAPNILGEAKNAVALAIQDPSAVNGGRASSYGFRLGLRKDALSFDGMVRRASKELKTNKACENLVKLQPLQRGSVLLGHLISKLPVSLSAEKINIFAEFWNRNSASLRRVWPKDNFVDISTVLPDRAPLIRSENGAEIEFLEVLKPDFTKSVSVESIADEIVAAPTGDTGGAQISRENYFSPTMALYNEDVSITAFQEQNDSRFKINLVRGRKFGENQSLKLQTGKTLLKPAHPATVRPLDQSVLGVDEFRNQILGKNPMPLDVDSRHFRKDSRGPSILQPCFDIGPTDFVRIESALQWEFQRAPRETIKKYTKRLSEYQNWPLTSAQIREAILGEPKLAPTACASCGSHIMAQQAQSSHEPVSGEQGRTLEAISHVLDGTAGETEKMGLFKAYCHSCHGEDEPVLEPAFTSLHILKTKGAAKRLRENEMPPPRSREAQVLKTMKGGREALIRALE